MADSYADFRDHRLFSAAVPTDLGGGGASFGELCNMLTELAHHCSSSALALSMHTHSVANAVSRLRHGDPTAEPLLRRIAADELIVSTSAGSDWLESSGKAEKAPGGYRVSARKSFCSGVRAADLFISSAVSDDPKEGLTVLHFVIPRKTPGIAGHENWRALGMRGTGSDDVSLEGVFVPEEAVFAKRPQGKWSAFFDRISPMVQPIIGAVYLGVVEAARNLALARAERRREDPILQQLAGEMETELSAARLALREMIALADDYGYVPSPALSGQVYMSQALLNRSLLAGLEKAMAVSGGGSYLRELGLERLYRDAQALRYHPLQEKRQRLLCGRIALGLEPSPPTVRGSTT